MQPDPQPATDSLYGRLERLAFAAGAIIMLGIVAASAWLSINNESRLNDAAQTQETRARTVDLLQAVTSAETGQRGFLLTGKASYLTPYRQAARQNLLVRAPAMSTLTTSICSWRLSFAV